MSMKKGLKNWFECFTEEQLVFCDFKNVKKQDHVTGQAENKKQHHTGQASW